MSRALIASWIRSATPATIAVLLVLALALVLSGGGPGPWLALGAAAGVALLATLGTERAGVLMLLGAYATAPMYKGLAPDPESVITPTDLFLLGGFALLAPTLLGRRIPLPGVLVLGWILVVCTGLIGSAVSDDPLASYLALAFWVIVMIALPVVLAGWAPSTRLVELLVAAFVGGHMVSTAMALVDGPLLLGRYVGLTTHPNYFAQSGLMAFVGILFLLPRWRAPLLRLALAGAAVACLLSVWLSGSRAATVVVVVIMVMIPIVERSAPMGFVAAIAGGLGFLLFSLAVESAAPGSSLARLGGDTSAQFADQERAQGLDVGIQRFLDSPIIGSGLIDLFDIHNNFVEVVVGIGILGLLGYLMVMFAFARPLFGTHPYRRLGYATWAYLGFGATIPSLYDRSIWLMVALGVLVYAIPADSADADPAGPLPEPVEGTVEDGRDVRGAGQLSSPDPAPAPRIPTLHSTPPASLRRTSRW